MGSRRAILVSLAGLVVLSAGCHSTFAQTLPDMPSVSKPNPEPTLPVAFDAFTPPVAPMTPPGNAPQIAEYTHTATNGQTIVLSGENWTTGTVGGSTEGYDTVFQFWGQTGSLQRGSIQRVDARIAQVTVPSGLPSWGTYMVWAQNAAGTSYPKLLYGAEAWWLSSDKASMGSTVSVMGRNLSHNAGTTEGWVYIKPVGIAAGQFATTTTWNPYKINFTVPTNLTNGTTYEVWVHNGSGAHYGWSGPLLLSVQAEYVWNSTDFNVMSYGATGNGTTDDATAINSAISAAALSPGSSVYFPAGTYLVGSTIFLGSGPQIRFRGASKTTSIIKKTTTTGSLFQSGTGTQDRFTFTNLKLDTSTATLMNSAGTAPVPTIRLDMADDIVFDNVDIESGRNQTMVLNNGNYLTIQNSTIVGQALFFENRKFTLISGNTFKGTGFAGSILNPWGYDGLMMVNNSFSDFSSPNDVASRVLACNLYHGSAFNTYLQANTTTNFGASSADPNQNTGEQLLWQEGQVYQAAAPTSATATSVTFSSINTPVSTYSTNLVATVYKGKGMGQVRRVTGVNGTTHVVTVTPAWSVQPDTTSFVAVHSTANRLTAYKNTFQGKSDYISRLTASTAFELFDGGSEVNFDGNVISQVRTGFFPWARWNGVSPGQPAGGPNVDSGFALFGLYQNNSVNGAYYGFNAAQDKGVEIGIIGNTFRSNTGTNLVAAGFSNEYANELHTTLSIKSVDMIGNILDNNTLGTIDETSSFTPVAPQGIVLTTNHDTMLINNKSSLGTAVSGSLGFDALNTGTPAFRSNTWTGFDTTYSGSTPGHVLEVPFRTVSKTGTAGGTASSATITLWNSGTASLTWTATSDSPTWLTLTTASGTIANETLSGGAVISCNPGSLTAGTYTGHITITDGATNKVVTVTFIVS